MPPSDVAAVLEEPSRRIGRYVLLEELGRGGMGVVHRGYDLSLRRHVAIKMISLGSGADERQIRRFEREAVAAAKLRHPGIVAVHEAGVHEGRPFIVMDLVDGESLETALERGALSPKRIAEIIHDVARALEHAHEHGIVHRDVKPENILVDAEGKAYLTDFGLARELDAAADRLTMSGQIVGTPAYMSPEQAISGRGAPGPAADIYAAGGVLYRAVTGRPPFDATELIALVHQVVAVDPVPPRQISPAVHPDIETIALRCLEKEPDRRYGSAADLAADLRRFLDGELIVARPVGRVARARRWSRRNRWKAVGAAAVLAVCVGSITIGVGMAVSISRRAEAERSAVIAKAADRARATRESFDRARTQAVEAGDAETVEARRRRHDRLLGLGLQAMQAAATRHALDLGDRVAARAEFDTTMEYGRVALGAEQWSVAAAAFDRAGDLGVDDAAAEGAGAEVDLERERQAKTRRDAVLAVLADSRAGRLERRGAYDAALFTLVRLPESQTVELIVAALDAITGELHGATRAELLSAARPTPDEAAAGEVEVAGLAAAIDRYLAWPLDAPPEVTDDRSTLRVVTTAGERLVRRLVRGRSRFGGDTELGLADVLAAAQERRLGRAGIVTARLCAEALGRLAIREVALDALARYIVAEHDEERAAVAGVSLGLLGGERGLELIEAGRSRFGRSGSFARRTAYFIERVIEESGDDVSAPDRLVHRGRLRLRQGELEAAEVDLLRALEAAPRSAVVRVGLADLAMARGRPHEALEQLERAVAIDPGNLDARKLRVVAWHALGEIDRALAEAQAAVAVAPGQATVYISRSVIRLATGNVAGSLDDAERALSLDAREPTAWTARARALSELGRFEQARADIDEAIELDPDDVQARVLRARIRRLAGDRAGGRADLERALELDPRYASAWTARALDRIEEGDFAGAVADAGRALELRPDDLDGRLVRGRALLAQGEVEAAATDLERAREIAPDSAFVWEAIGQLEGRRENLDAALAAHERAVELSPGSSHRHMSLALVLQRRGELAAARLAADRAIELEPTRASSWVNRSSIRFSAEDFEGAIADARRAIEIDAGEGRGWYNLGVALRSLKRTDEGIEAFDRAIEHEPMMVEAWSARASARIARDDFAGAIADADRAVELDPRAITAWVSRGIGRVQSGDPEGAVADLGRALDLAPNRTVALEYRALAFERLGRFDDAIVDLERLAGLKPDAALHQVDLARCLRKDEQLEAARDAANRAIELAPGAIDGWVERAYARRELGDLEGAIADFERAREIDTEQASIVQVIGMTRAELGRHAEAIEDFGVVIRMQPDYPLPWRDRAFSRAVVGDEEGAVRDVEELGRLDGGFWIHYARGVILVALDREDDAVRAFERANAVGTGSGWANAWLIRLGRAAADLLEGEEGVLGVIGRHHAGELDPDALLKAAQEVADDDDARAANRCEVEAILAFAAERAGDRDEAIARYRASVKEDQREDWHWRFAVIRLRKLGAAR